MSSMTHSASSGTVPSAGPDNDPETSADEPVEVSQLIVPLDGSPFSERALPVADWIAAQLGADVHLVEVVPTDGEGERTEGVIRYLDDVARRHHAAAGTSCVATTWPKRSPTRRRRRLAAWSAWRRTGGTAPPAPSVRWREGIGNAMATGFASALSEGQPAQLDLGEEAVPCLVVGFTGADVVLAPGGEFPPDALAPGNTSYLLIEAGGSLQALKAHVRAGLQPRASSSPRCSIRSGSASAAPSAAPRSSCPRTCARPATEDPPKTTFTRDISAGGLRVAAPVRATARPTCTRS